MTATTTTRRVRRLRDSFLPRTCAHDQAEATHAVEQADPDGRWRVVAYVCDHDAQVAVQRGAVLADRYTPAARPSAVTA